MKTLASLSILLLSLVTFAQSSPEQVAIKAAQEKLGAAAKGVQGKLVGSAKAQQLYSFGDAGVAEKTYLVTQAVEEAQAPVGQTLVMVLVYLDFTYMDDGGNELEYPGVSVKDVRRVSIAVLD